LLAEAVNQCMAGLLHGETRWMTGRPQLAPAAPTVSGGIADEEEEQQLEALNAWVETQGLPPGELAFDFADPGTGEQKAVFDLAWPRGLQEELSEPVAVLLNESTETIAIASQAGFRCFTDVGEFKQYVSSEVVVEGETA
jgi:hypothetical protein